MNRSALEQAVLNNVKMARNLIRTRHSILADEELNDALPGIRRRLEEQAQTGQVVGLSKEELLDLLLGEAA